MATTSEIKEKQAEELRPPNHDYSHQDSLFGNAFSSKAYFVVHPEWLSENVDPPKSKPLNRPPWPWEQPKYRQNIKLSQLNQNGNGSNVRRRNEHESSYGNGNEIEKENGFENGIVNYENGSYQRFENKNITRSYGNSYDLRNIIKK